MTGPSGCGKSTLLQLLGGLDRTSGGEITIAATRVDRPSERAPAKFRCGTIGFVFQAFQSTDELTAVENPRPLPVRCQAQAARAPRSGAAGPCTESGPALLPGNRRQCLL